MYTDTSYCPEHMDIILRQCEDQYQRDYARMDRLEAYHRSTIGARAAAALMKEPKRLLWLESLKAKLFRALGGDI